MNVNVSVEYKEKIDVMITIEHLSLLDHDSLILPNSIPLDRLQNLKDNHYPGTLICSIYHWDLYMFLKGDFIFALVYKDKKKRDFERSQFKITILNREDNSKNISASKRVSNELYHDFDHYMFSNEELLRCPSSKQLSSIINVLKTITSKNCSAAKGYVVNDTLKIRLEGSLLNTNKPIIYKQLQDITGKVDGEDEEKDSVLSDLSSVKEDYVLS